MQQITTFEEACAITGDSPLLPYPTPANKDEEADNYMRQMRIIARALNPKDYQPNYVNGNERKWYPWMIYDASSSCFRFIISCYDYTFADAGSGVRLCSEEISDYFGRTFATLISNHLLTQQ
jgi:hypothetical protein